MRVDFHDRWTGCSVSCDVSPSGDVEDMTIDDIPVDDWEEADINRVRLEGLAWDRYCELQPDRSYGVWLPAGQSGRREEWMR